MDYSLDTPFTSYQEIVAAVKEERASLHYQRAAAYGIASADGPAITFSILLIPVVSVISMLIACMVLDESNWLLLFGVLSLPLYMVIPNIRKFLLIIGIGLFALPFVMEDYYFLEVLGVGVFGMLIGYDIWWGIIAEVAKKYLLSNEVLFESIWIRGEIALKTDENGVLYYYGRYKNRGAF